MHKRKIILIGGSKQFGSGKVVSKLKSYFDMQKIDFLFIETQGTRLNIVCKIYQIPKKSLVIYQPSVCFPAFFRDILILSILYLRRADINFLLLVDVQFKNVLLRYAFVRKLFFGDNRVFGLATPSLRVNRFEKISFFFESKRLQKDIVSRTENTYSLVHFGYRSVIKGWHSFYSIASQFYHTTSFSYIGRDDMTLNELQIIEGYRSANNVDIEHTLKTNFEKKLPIYLFCGHEDFAPLMILECGWWGVPIICVKNSKAENILTRFIPTEFFICVEIRQLDAIDLNQVNAAAMRFSAFLKNHHEDQFCHDIVAKLIHATS